MSITLMPETEARLRTRAAQAGQDINAFANALLLDALNGHQEEDADDLTEEQVAEIRAGIRRGLKAAAEGRELAK